jgi:hypothetical protein|tara:strand:+ start:778 stop:984 length:207 start_codon:yes stop_codon:yes gene_type:complete
LVGFFNSITGKQKFLTKTIDGRNFFIDLKVAIGNIIDYGIYYLPIFRDPGIFIDFEVFEHIYNKENLK